MEESSQEVNDGDDNDIVVGCVDRVAQISRLSPIYVFPRINNQIIQMEVNTGSAVSIISEND